ncbi:hypothetical protein GGI12_002671 [Dipsacomyces acuminosporus]|nr:hypothetical protein GGI12_002671 [Dipsacomyces acuminosporus]
MAKGYTHLVKLPTSPIVFHVKPFDEEDAREAKKSIPSINKELTDAYMTRLKALYSLPEHFDIETLRVCIDSLTDFKKEATVEMIDEKLQQLRDKNYIATPDVMKREILKKSWSVVVNIRELAKELTDYSVNPSIVQLVVKMIETNKGLPAHGDEWKTMGVYEIDETTIMLTMVFLRSNSRDAKVTPGKMIRFFEEKTAAELFIAKIVVLPAGLEHLKQAASAFPKSKSKKLAKAAQNK